MAADKLLFATYTESPEGLREVYLLVQSLRTFGGQYDRSPVWLYIPEDIDIEDTEWPGKLRSLGVELRASRTPEAARWFFYAGKVYAAAKAEAAAEGRVPVLVWLDADTIVLSEPTELDLSADVSLAYCPVMHNRSGTIYDAPPNEFWSRIYEKLSLTDDMLFPMVTPADKQTIRAYFHVGLLAVRPERNILRGWAGDFEVLYTDPVLAEMCKSEVDKRIFLHQTALTGTVLTNLRRDELMELSGRYNYPIFFEKQYGAIEPFNSLEDVVTIRRVVSDKYLPADWYDELAGPIDRIAWLREHLERE